MAVDVVVDATALIQRAREAIERAYAPYSHFPVGAAVMDDGGRIFTGANIENASYGLTICAERVAIFTAVAAGARRIIAIAVTATNKSGVTPCGACRQVIAEFCDPTARIYSDATDRIVELTAGALLPNAFGASDLKSV